MELWFAIGDGRIFLSHEGKKTDWMLNVEKNPVVSFEIGGSNYVGQAHFLRGDSAEDWSGKVALYEKYYGKASKAVIEDWFSLSRLVAIESQ